MIMSEKSPLIAEYIWLDGNGILRSKARTIEEKEWSVKTLPLWDYDGSSTGQASTENSEILLKPRAVFRCPFRQCNNILILCATYNLDDSPTASNHRDAAEEIFNKKLKEKPWFGIEQEFFVMAGSFPPEYPSDLGAEPPKGNYCSVGTHRNGRELIEKFYGLSLYAGINISGINSEVAAGQWEYQVGPVEGIAAADQLWVSRFILLRLSENYNLTINFEPKPEFTRSLNLNGSGCHVNFSTLTMRSEDGLKVIEEAIGNLGLKHKEHMEVYGVGNELRMTGLNETSKFDEFSVGVANRGASIRIPNNTSRNKCGYFEDRRPASNMDPYQVTSILLKTTTD